MYASRAHFREGTLRTHNYYYYYRYEAVAQFEFLARISGRELGNAVMQGAYPG